MTPTGISELAERARDAHSAVLGITPAPWHLAPKVVRDAWLATVALVIAQTKRESGNDD
jgi:hypothetical protein